MPSATTDPKVTPTSGKYFTKSPIDGVAYDKLIVWLIEASDIPALDGSRGKSDVTVTADVSGGREPVAPPPAGLSKCEFGTEKNVAQLPNWDRKRIILFQRGCADKFNLRVYDSDLLDVLGGNKGGELLTLSTR